MKKHKEYKVYPCVGGKFTATNNAFNRTTANSYDYKTFDTREEAQAWADEQNQRATKVTVKDKIAAFHAAIDYIANHDGLQPEKRRNV